MVGIWSSAMPESEETEAASSAPFWAALTTAYKSLNEVRLLGGDQRPALAMMDVLRIYRNQVESGVRELPSAGEARGKLPDRPPHRPRPAVVQPAEARPGWAFLSR